MLTVIMAGTAAYVAGRGPPSVPGAAAVFARAVVAGCGDLERERAKSLLWAAGRLAGWGIGLGLDPAPEVLLHPSPAERFAAHSPGLSPAARRTLRTNLRFIARRVVPALWPEDAPLPRERAKAPYSLAEISGFLALADAQPTTGRRMRVCALACLGAGAGLAAGDLRAVRGTDVTARSGGVIAGVRGARPRAVPALARYHGRLLESAAFAGGRLITGGRDPGRRNVTCLLTSRLAGGAGLPPLDASRLRMTWMRDCAGLLGLPAFMRAAGITCCQRPGDIVAGLEPGGEAEAVRLPGGTR